MRRLLAVSALSAALAGCGGDPQPAAGGPGGAVAGAASTAGPGRGPGQNPQAPPTKTRVGFYESEEARETPFLEIKTWTNREVRPLPGVDYDLYWQTDEGPNVSHGLTNAEGLERVGLPSTAKIHRLQIRAGPFVAPVNVPIGQYLQPGRVLRVDVLVAPAAVIAGVVLDENGQPVPKAQLAAFHQPPARVDEQERPVADAKGEADEEGRFVMGGFPAGPFVLEAFKDDSAAAWRVTGALQEGQQVQGVEILLAPCHPVYGQVLDSEGQPIAGARVVAGKKGRRSLSRPGPIPEISAIPGRQIVAISDEKGAFVLGAVPLDQEWNLNVEHLLHRRHLGVIEAGRTDVLIRMEAGLRVEGVVRDEQDQPVHRAGVTLLGKDVIPGSATTDRDGRFGFGGLEPNEALWLVCAQPGYAPLLRGPLALSDAPLTGIELRLPEARRIAGKALGADGRPVAGARIALRRTDLPTGVPEAGIAPLVLGRASVLTGDGGEFAFEELAAGSYELQATSPNGANLRQDGVAAGSEALELRFP